VSLESVFKSVSLSPDLVEQAREVELFFFALDQDRWLDEHEECLLFFRVDPVGEESAQDGDLGEHGHAGFDFDLIDLTSYDPNAQ